MAINMMCMNSDCKYYWEDNCSRNINEEYIVIGEYGNCETFKEGVSDWYKQKEARPAKGRSRGDSCVVVEFSLRESN